MALSDEFENQGKWLFRWRGFLPLMFIPLMLVALRHVHWPFGSFAFHEAWEFACLCLSLFGMVIRVLAVGYAPAQTSGRNTKRQIAAQLNTTGMYSIVRHPLYVGNFLIGFGVVLVQMVWWLPVLYILLFWLYYERIMFAEEAFLHRSFGSVYDDWASDTPAFWPRVSQWRRPALPFSIRSTMRREYSGLMIVILGHAGVEFTEHLFIDHRIVYEFFWVCLIIGGAVTYFAIRMLKRHTSVLDVLGR